MNQRMVRPLDHFAMMSWTSCNWRSVRARCPSEMNGVVSDMHVSDFRSSVYKVARCRFVIVYRFAKYSAVANLNQGLRLGRPGPLFAFLRRFLELMLSHSSRPLR